MLPGEELPSVVVMFLAMVVVAEVVVLLIPVEVVVVLSVGVEVIFVPVVVVVLLVAEVVVAVVIPVGAVVGGAGQSPGRATVPNSLPVRSGPEGDSSSPQNRPYHK